MDSVSSSLSGVSMSAMEASKRADSKLKGRLGKGIGNGGSFTTEVQGARPMTPGSGRPATPGKPTRGFWALVGAREEELDAERLRAEVEKRVARVVRASQRVAVVNSAIQEARSMNDLSLAAALRVELKAVEKQW